MRKHGGRREEEDRKERKRREGTKWRVVAYLRGENMTQEEVRGKEKSRGKEKRGKTSSAH